MTANWTCDLVAEMLLILKHLFDLIISCQLLDMPVHKISHDFLWYANDVHLSAIWENTALVQWIRTKHEQSFFSSHDQVTHNITAINCSSNDGRPMARVRYGLIPIGPIRLIGKTEWEVVNLWLRPARRGLTNWLRYKSILILQFKRW